MTASGRSQDNFEGSSSSCFSLFRDNYGCIGIPVQHKNVFYSEVKDDVYDQFALLDYIEFMGENVRDIANKTWHGYFQHYDLSIKQSNAVFEKFREDINAIFVKTGLLYELNEEGCIERVEENGVLDITMETSMTTVSEAGIQELLTRAIVLHLGKNKEVVFRFEDDVFHICFWSRIVLSLIRRNIRQRMVLNHKYGLVSFFFTKSSKKFRQARTMIYLERYSYFRKKK